MIVIAHRGASFYRRHDIVARTVMRVDRNAVIVSFGRAALLEARRLRPGRRR